MGSFVIHIPPISIARELWRLGEPELADRAAKLAVMLAAIEHLEGKARPCARRLPETQLPPALQSTEDERWAALAAMSQQLHARPRGLRALFRRSG
ncbi:hypothetical protein [Kribbella sp. NPDC049227]|uniref:hypothetical protein n=1 Tax=Kribbella sp. NPDC049227 TaxID=3364113 RepID=UPI00371F365A